MHADSLGVPNQISSLNNFDIGPVFASRIKKLRKSFTWWNQLLCRSVLTPNSCTKFKIHLAHADSLGVPNPISSLNNFDIGPVFASQINKVRKSFTWLDQLLCRSVLTPNSSTKFTIHLAHADSLGVPNPISSLNNLILDQSLPHRSRNSERALLGGTNSLAGQFLHQTPLQFKLKIHSEHADSPGVPNPISSLNNFDIGLVFDSQITKLRKSFT